uniref:ES cell-expressed Ras n=1 Tax=Jaculus jaculus TaxID=51337 RepID=A0A8C5P1A7_JACJA
TWRPEDSHEAWAHCKDVGWPEYKLVMVGASSVSKSALMIQATHQRFVKEHDPTIQDSYCKELALDNGRYILNVLNLAGQDIQTALCDQCLALGNGMLGVFALSDPSSLNQMQQMWATWCPHHNQPLVLASNKCDLVSTTGDTHDVPQSSPIGVGIPFMKTSTKAQQGVEEALLCSPMTFRVLSPSRPCVAVGCSVA